MRLLVCGGAGFIGSTFVRQRLLEHGDDVTVLDKLTYAGREENLQDIAEHASFRFLRGAIEDPAAVAGAIEAGSPEAIVNFAAETHVDRSIAEPDAFVSTHALGTYVLLEAARSARAALRAGLDRRGVRLDRRRHRSPRTRPCAPPRPTRPPRRARTCSCRATSTPTSCPRVICRGSNNYGPYQYPEKLIPLMILNALQGDPLPVYGDGDAGAQLDPLHRLRRRDRPRARARRPRRGVQRRRSRRAAEHRCCQPHRRVDRAPSNRRSSTSRTGPDTTAATRSPPRRSARSDGPRRCASATASSRRSPGTARTPGGGNRSARATIASTTNGSTGVRCAEQAPPRPSPAAAHCMPEIFHLPPSLTSVRVPARLFPCLTLFTWAVAVGGVLDAFT